MTKNTFLSSYWKDGVSLEPVSKEMMSTKGWLIFFCPTDVYGKLTY